MYAKKRFILSFSFDKNTLLSSHGHGHTVMKNCEPFVLGPAFAIDSINGFLCYKISISVFSFRRQKSRYEKWKFYKSLERSRVLTLELVQILKITFSKVYLQIGNELILEFAAPNRFTSCTRAQWATGLNHETLDNTMKYMSIVVAITNVHDKVFHRFWTFIFEQSEIDIALTCT